MSDDADYGHDYDRQTNGGVIANLKRDIVIKAATNPRGVAYPSFILNFFEKLERLRPPDPPAFAFRLIEELLSAGLVQFADWRKDSPRDDPFELVSVTSEKLEQILRNYRESGTRCFLIATERGKSWYRQYQALLDELQANRAAYTHPANSFPPPSQPAASTQQTVSSARIVFPFGVPVPEKDELKEWYLYALAQVDGKLYPVSFFLLSEAEADLRHDAQHNETPFLAEPGLIILYNGMTIAAMEECVQQLHQVGYFKHIRPIDSARLPMSPDPLNWPPY